MSTMMYRASIVLSLLIVSIFYAQIVRAQIAPTTTAAISGSVSDSTGNPIAGAKVSLSGPKSASAQTDIHGFFVFVGVPFGTYQISASAANFGTATRSVLVQNDVNVAIQYEPLSHNGLKTIANVSASTNATFNVTPASITQVNPMANAFEGKTSWRTILEQIPGLSQAGLLNGNSALNSMPSGPFVPVKIAINGALPYETAILLDDMPLIGGPNISASLRAGSGTDLGSYPLNGFSEADVVRGPGANAPSIVDSIGGSFVLHPPGIVSHNAFNFSWSTDPYGGIITNGQALLRWNKLSVAVTYGINDSPGPVNGAGNGIAAIGPTPVTVNGQPFSPGTNCTYQPGGSCTANFPTADSQFQAGTACYAIQNGLLTGGFNQSTAWSQHSGSVALNYALSPSLNAEVYYAGQVSQGILFTPYFGQTYFLPPAGYAGALSPGQYSFTDAYDNLVPYSLESGSRLLEEKVTAQMKRGILRVAMLQNRTFTTYSLSAPSSANVQLYGGGQLNGVNTIFNGQTYAVTYDPLEEHLFYGSNNRDLLLSYTTPLGENLQAGASFVKSYYDIPTQQIIGEGGTVFVNTVQPTAISQTTNELRFFIGGEPSAKTSVDLSMYFANANYHVPDPNNHAINRNTYANATYVDAQYNYAAPRLGFVWRPTASVAVRASAGGGFAEAPLSQLIGSSGIPIWSPANLNYTVTQTNTNIQPEKSFSFDVGTDVRVGRDTLVSFDAYRSNLYGQLYSSTSVTGTYNDGSHGSAPLLVTQNGNLGLSRYEGLLFELRHTIPHGLYWGLAGGLTRGYIVSLPAGFYNTAGGICNPSTGANCKNLTVVPNINFNGTFVASIPYASAHSSIGYRWRTDKYVELVGTYYGNNNTYYRPAFVEFDGNVSYPVAKNASLLVTFLNITGVYDQAVNVVNLGSISGAPTISGLPAPLFGQAYGPRTVILTMQMHL